MLLRQHLAALRHLLLAHHHQMLLLTHNLPLSQRLPVWASKSLRVQWATCQQQRLDPNLIPALLKQLPLQRPGALTRMGPHQQAAARPTSLPDLGLVCRLGAHILLTDMLTPMLKKRLHLVLGQPLLMGQPLQQGRLPTFT